MDVMQSELLLKGLSLTGFEIFLPWQKVRYNVLLMHSILNSLRDCL